MSEEWEGPFAGVSTETVSDVISVNGKGGTSKTTAETSRVSLKSRFKQGRPQSAFERTKLS